MDHWPAPAINHTTAPKLQHVMDYNQAYPHAQVQRLHDSLNCQGDLYKTFDQAANTWSLGVPYSPAFIEAVSEHRLQRCTKDAWMSKFFPTPAGSCTEHTKTEQPYYEETYSTTPAYPPLKPHCFVPSQRGTLFCLHSNEEGPNHKPCEDVNKPSPKKSRKLSADKPHDMTASPQVGVYCRKCGTSGPTNIPCKL